MTKWIKKRRLYKKGDKVTLTAEVVGDQESHAHAVWVKYLSGRTFPVNGSILDEGVLEPVPEPPYVPKTGDRFKLLIVSSGRIASDIARCVFSDDHTVLYEYEGYPHIRHHLKTGTGLHTFIKVDEES